MKKRVLTLALGLLFGAGCAGTPRPNLPPTDALDKWMATLLPGVTAGDAQLNGIAGAGQPVLAASTDAANPVLAEAVRFALEKGLIENSAYLLKVTPERQVAAKVVICPTEMVPRCRAVPLTTPVRVYTSEIPGTEGFLLASRIRIRD